MSESREWMAEMLMCAAEDLPPESTPLAEVEGWDSLRHVGLILGLEAKLKRKLTADEIRGVVTVGNVAAILGQNVVDA